MNETGNDALNTLRDAQFPAPTEAARQRALAASLHAFDAAQGSTARAKGNSAAGRLRSVLSQFGRSFLMDNRLTYGLGTAAIALLVLPLGYQLYLSTAMSPVGPAIVAPSTTTAMSEAAPATDADADAQIGRAADTVVSNIAPQPAEMEQRKVRTVTVSPEGVVAPQAASELRRGLEQLAESPAIAPPLPLGDSPSLFTDLGNGLTIGAGLEATRPAPQVSAAVAPQMDAALPPPTEPSGDQFTRFTESPVKSVASEPVSTFSVDVDTASYAYVRQSLGNGFVPEPDAVRIEEMINYFSYDYPAPESAETPFATSLSVFPTPWNDRTELVRIGIKGFVPPVGDDKASNLTFLIDTSGSMQDADKLPLLKRAFALLVDQLGDNDTISIVAYAGSAGVVLEPTAASDKAKVLAALDRLEAGGSTAGAEGIALAYQLADQHKVEGGINRVILATDGDFNVGIDDPEALEDFIKGKRDAGVFLSVLGFGQGNLGDDTMQALAQNGNGTASYIDSFREAQKVLVAEIGGTLETIAKDVKVQVEFNPAVVAEYRLVGYETRALYREDFNNDRVDAGDIGAGHTVTALYEITPVGSGAELIDPLRYGAATTPAAGATNEIGFVKLRYKLPDADESRLIEMPIDADLAAASLDAASADDRWAAAVAAFGQKLKGSHFGEISWDGIRALAQGARGEDETGYRAEFMQLIDMAKVLAPADVTSAAPTGN